MRQYELQLTRSRGEIPSLWSARGLYSSSSKETLHDLKHTSRGGVAYQAAKRLLRGVPVPGEGVVTGVFERCKGVMVTSVAPLGDDEAEPPFAGWLVSGEPFEGFNRDGNVVG